MSEIGKRLARGERGIPKIPDSPDTRHAQAQPPRPGEHPCIDCGGNTTGYDALVWLPTLQKRAPIHQICLDAIIQKHFDAAGPAEQPAPPPCDCWCHKDRSKDALPKWTPEHHCCTPSDNKPENEQPSAPPQPAEICPQCGVINGCHAFGCRWTAQRAAEPSVEARQPLVDEMVMKHGYDPSFEPFPAWKVNRAIGRAVTEALARAAAEESLPK